MASNQEVKPEAVAKERKDVIQTLALKSKKNPGLENPSLEETSLLSRLDLLLTRLEDEVHMTPEFKQKTLIDEGLKVIFDKPDQFKFPPEYVDRARALYQKWESESWGALVAIEDDDADESGGDVQVNEMRVNSPKKRQRLQSSNGDSSYLRLPRPDHPIWGRQGIMHGICQAISINGRRSPQLDPRYDNEKRPANVLGHNGLTVGAWFPLQLVALFKGAHGSAQAGIYGTEERGAFSVIVSGLYDDLDRDYGEYLYYSGSNSHDNTDPKRPADSSAGTLALYTSLQTQQPVRLLRSSKGKSKWCPTEGLRYDGLYKVVSSNHAYNAKGGMFEQFRLERCEGQRAINKFRPTTQEQEDFERIKDGFPKDRS